MVPLTKEQAIVLTAMTEILLCKFEDFHAEVEKRLGYAVFTHQFGDKNFVNTIIKPAFNDDFLAMVANVR